MELTPAEQEGFDHLIPRELQTGDLDADLILAAREALRRREQNTIDGGAVLAGLHRHGYSWREIADLTGIPFNTARRWAVPPGQADAAVADEED